MRGIRPSRSSPAPFPDPRAAMADHKAPTQVTIAPYKEDSELQKAVNAYWKPFMVVAVLITAAIIWNQISKEKTIYVHDQSWGTLGTEVDLARIGQGTALPSAHALGDLATNLDGTIAAPWAKSLEIERLIEDQDWQAAEAAIAQLEADFPDHPLVREGLPIGPDRAVMTLPARLRAYITSERAFTNAHPTLFALPELPPGSPRVELDTTAGKIVVGLYQDRAPLHVANFLKLVSSGYYDGTKFHRVIPGFMVQGGDPNSKVGDPSTWGSGGPDYKIPAEISDLYHFKGVLAAAKLGDDVESSGSQFYLTTGAPHHLDGKHTVFGVLLEGEDAVRVIENSPTAPGTDRPENPKTITKAIVLE